MWHQDDDDGRITERRAEALLRLAEVSRRQEAMRRECGAQRDHAEEMRLEARVLVASSRRLIG